MQYAGWIELTNEVEGDGRLRVFVRKDAIVSMSETIWPAMDDTTIHTLLHLLGGGYVTVSGTPEEVLAMLRADA